MIKISNLTKNYPKTKVFNQFSIEFREGEVTCVLGESGCGKTTLLNVIANLTDYEGEVDRVKCSYVFQTPNLFYNLTARENLALVLGKNADVDGFAEVLGVKGKLDSYPKRLSGGEAQRVALIRGVMYSADLLLMDEPFSSLDLSVKYRTMNVLRERFKKENKTVIMVTHDIHEAVTMADRIIILSGGKIVYDNSEVNEKTEKELFGLLIGMNDN